MMLRLSVYLAGTDTTYVYHQVGLALGASFGTDDIETGRQLDATTGRIEAGVVDVVLDAPLFLGAATRRAVPRGAHRAQLVDVAAGPGGADVVLADGVVRQAELGHNDPGDDPARPLSRWSIRIADRALADLEAGLDGVVCGQAGFAQTLRDAGHALDLLVDVVGSTGAADTQLITFYDLSEVARLAVERAGGTVATWPARLAQLVASYDDGGTPATITRGGTLYVADLSTALRGEPLSTVPDWTGAEAVEAAGAYRRLTLSADYAAFPAATTTASFAPSGWQDPDAATVATLPVLDGVVMRPWAEAGRLASDSDLAVGFPAPDLERVPPAGVFERPAGWLRATTTGTADSLGVDALTHLADIEVEAIVTVSVGAYSEDVAVGRPVVYFEDDGVLVVVVEPAASGTQAVAYRLLPVNLRRFELAAFHWFDAHRERATDMDTLAVTVDLADAADAGVDVAAIALGDPSVGCVFDGEVWAADTITWRHDDGQLDLDLYRPGAIARGRAPSDPRATAAPALMARIEKQPPPSWDGTPETLGHVAVARASPGAGADAPDRYVYEVEDDSSPGTWLASDGVEDVLADDDHRVFRARAEYDAEGVVTAYTVASTDPAA